MQTHWSATRYYLTELVDKVNPDKKCTLQLFELGMINHRALAVGVWFFDWFDRIRGI